MLLKAFKYRLYPTPEQVELIEKHINASRFVYNLALETRQYAYKSLGVNLTEIDLANQLPALKQECKWLRGVNAHTLQTSILNLKVAYDSFFKGGGFPRFKKKSASGSFSAVQDKGTVRLSGLGLRLPKFKSLIPVVLHRPIVGDIKRVSVSKTSTGKYFASVLCETKEVIAGCATTSPIEIVGVDLGIKSFLVTSEGEVVDNPKHLNKAFSKLRYLQRKASKHKGKRTRKKVAVLHEKVANRRKDFLHKVSTRLIRENQAIAVESLKVSNMAKNPKLARHIMDAGWGMFVAMLEYKAAWYGNSLLKIGTFEPSSKTCSCCGEVNKDLTLKEREWVCLCGAELDRDVNAAVNIKNFALKNLSMDRRLKNRKELPALAGV